MILEVLEPLRGPTSRLRPLGSALGPSGLLDNVLHALWALRPYDTNGSMTALSVSEISALGGFCDAEQEQQQLEKWGILVVGYQMYQVNQKAERSGG